MNNNPIENVIEIKDLGILFQYDLKFKKHIDYICIKATRKFNYIKYVCRSFRNIHVLINLYNALIKSTLMFGSTIWNPTNKALIKSLERIQNKFLRFLSYRTNHPMRYIDHDYQNIMNISKLSTLEIARAKNDMKFVHKIANTYLNTPDLKSNIMYYTPMNKPRSKTKIFLIDQKMIPFSIIHRICNLINLNKDWIFVKDLSIVQFQNLLQTNTIKLNDSPYEI